jgi:uncharacterized phiE125 gp8 family phage protein
MAMSPGYGLTQLVGPVAEPVTTADMLGQSRLISTDTDSVQLAFLITAAREYVETCTRRQLMTAQYLLTLDQFPGRQVDDYRPPTWRYGILRMPLPPLQSVQSIQYIDPSQQTYPFTLTTLVASSYQLSLNTEPGRVAPAPYQVWPATNPLAMEAVQVTFTAGYTSAGAVPARVKMAIRLLTAHLYEHREEGLEAALSKMPYGLAAFIHSMRTGEYA